MNDKENLNKSFSQLHINLINQIVKFCKENNIDNAEWLSLSADCLASSIKFGEWNAATDSSFVIFDKDKNVILSSI